MVEASSADGPELVLGLVAPVVSVGIRQLYFIDPYPKSRVPEMFGDSIVVDREVDGKIPFRAFTGIAPRLYAEAFSAPNRRDGDRWLDWEKIRHHQLPRKSASPNTYMTKEDEALKLLKTRMTSTTRSTT